MIKMSMTENKVIYCIQIYSQGSHIWHKSPSKSGIHKDPAIFPLKINTETILRYQVSRGTIIVYKNSQFQDHSPFTKRGQIIFLCPLLYYHYMDLITYLT